MKKDPAKTIIKYLGGVKKVASIIGRHPSRINKWALPIASPEGQGGIVPAQYQVLLLKYCKEHEIDFCPDDFFNADRLKSIQENKRG